VECSSLATSEGRLFSIVSTTTPVPSHNQTTNEQQSTIHKRTTTGNKQTEEKKKDEGFSCSQFEKKKKIEEAMFFFSLSSLDRAHGNDKYKCTRYCRGWREPPRWQRRWGCPGFLWLETFAWLLRALCSCTSQWGEASLFRLFVPVGQISFNYWHMKERKVILFFFGLPRRECPLEPIDSWEQLKGQCGREWNSPGKWFWPSEWWRVLHFQQTPNNFQLNCRSVKRAQMSTGANNNKKERRRKKEGEMRTWRITEGGSPLPLRSQSGTQLLADET
jgi:hypothetical protein